MSNVLNVIKKIIINRIILISKKKKRRQIKTIFHDQKMIVKFSINLQLVFLNEKIKLLL